METKELKIQIPEGQEIDWQESAHQEKIVFKKKDTKPRSWEEYVAQHKQNTPAYFIDNESTVRLCGWYIEDVCMSLDYWKNVLPSKELAEAFLAMMQLMSLRQDWIHKWSIDNGMADDWEPDWSKGNYCVVSSDSFISATVLVNFTHPLSFPTEEMAKDFRNCFKDLLEIAKPLI